jgi:hypothetical protein
MEALTMDIVHALNREVSAPSEGQCTPSLVALFENHIMRNTMKETCYIP